MPKSRAIPLVSAVVIISIICKRRKRTSSSLHSDIIFSVSLSENVFFALEAVFDFPGGGDFLRHFDARKCHLPPLLSRNLSQNTSFSINFGYDCRSVLKHVLKSYDIFRDVHDSRKRVVGLIYTIQLVS